MDKVTVRTSLLGTPGAQDQTQSSHLSQNLQPISTHGNEGAAQIDSRRPSCLYDLHKPLAARLLPAVAGRRTPPDFRPLYP
ncbi:MAG TPA: hypothetical protein VM095_00930 [Pyrinomonadaceae bacterium]|nr:hypothetical protein [Pyrinomonadaceae bacterium]